MGLEIKSTIFPGFDGFTFGICFAVVIVIFVDIVVIVVVLVDIIVVFVFAGIFHVFVDHYVGCYIY